jgi:hypothetical protein
MNSSATSGATARLLTLGTEEGSPMPLRVWSKARRAVCAALVRRSRMHKPSARLTSLRAALVLAAALLSSGTPAPAQWAQQWLPISTGQPGTGRVALSADGNTALVGDIGAPWVFSRAFYTYFGYVYQQGPQLVGTGNGTSYAMALSADGNVAIVGTPDDSASTGAAWLFIRSGNTWTLLQKLVGSGGNAAGQGRSVALSADGSTAIVGATTSPSAWVFVRTQTMFGYIWAQQGQKLVGSGGGAGTGPRGVPNPVGGAVGRRQHRHLG